MRNKRYEGKFESLDFHTGDLNLWIRQCTCCGEQKSILEFHKNGTNEDGSVAYRTECKTCYNIKRNVNTSKNKKRHSDFVGYTRTERGEPDVQYSRQEWKECLIFFGGECAYCGATPRKGQSLTRDHLQAVDAGGKTTQANIIPACKSCNSSKGKTDFKDWFMGQSFFSQERLNRIFKWRTILRLVESEEGVETNESAGSE